ncbi:SDR family oxidoreductase [Labedaea rhizosphaerae]|uniref:NAD(P)-dependent dehydrogenase (Short-subunit alcohol dehydrogenase family) n=1 Tax=Labedaea rhizosphaerae TaxID=598644 RepID=A0A4R6SJP9_LABRH|nr:SDR family oxidoreductase [Labedaea rhizosphaerae]TDQ01169.1 NAD(P)-dependent dehydrogenase (short-subunit alcohol dehydrogenase family) [Labedaea rhizosphaerae]
MSKTIALVTGANKGIGKEIARGLARLGHTVLVGARDTTRGKEAVAELEGDGDVRLQQLDVTDAESIAAAAQSIENEFGRLDVLVNNAGILSMTHDDLRPIYETNVFGVVDVTNALLPLLRRSSAGRIVNVSSFMGSLTMMSKRLDGVPVSLAYPTSKAALNAITVQWATMLADTPIKVNAVCPGYCDTDLNDHSGPRTPAQGAAIAIKMATVDSDGPSGTFVDDNGEIPW